MNILPYGIWNDFPSCVLRSESTFEHSSLWDLKHGRCLRKKYLWRWFEHSSLWDLKQIETKTQKLVRIEFEHSSLWDLKQERMYLSASSVTSFEHSSLWDLKQMVTELEFRDTVIWTFFPMGFETWKIHRQCN